MVKKSALFCLFLALILAGCDDKEEAGTLAEISEEPSEDLSSDDWQDLTIEKKHWNRVFNKAFEPVNCPEPRDPGTLPDGYYKGPMIDAHIHLHSLPDGEPGHEDEFYTGENIGIRKSMEEWVCMLEHEGTYKAFGFFAVWDPIVDESIGLVEMTMEKHPGLFVPFIMPPDGDSPTVSAEKLEEMLNVKPGIFKGYGELGLYGNPNSAALPPDSKRLMGIYPVVREHNLLVYLHLGEDQKEALERAAEENPDITFIFHGDQLIDCGECDKTHSQVAEILEKHPNVYYGVDELYGGEWLLQPGRSKEDFMANFEDYGPLLEADLAKFKEFIEDHPDQVLWGTDRGVSASWDKDPDVALTLNNYARAFIGRLDPSVQEKFAYKNAEKLLQERSYGG